MFGFLKEKLKSAISKISRKVEEEAPKEEIEVETKVKEEKPKYKKKSEKVKSKKKFEFIEEEHKHKPEDLTPEEEIAKEPEKIVGVKIIYFAHGTTPDNEKGIFSGQSKISLSKLGKQQSKDLTNKINVCFETAHAFESGYDLRDGQAVKKTFAEFDKTTGLEKLKLIHLNDSKTALGSRSDRHADIGDGEIGLAGFSALIKFIKNKKLDIDLILETPTDSRRKKDIRTLKQIRDQR